MDNHGVRIMARKGSGTAKRNGASGSAIGSPAAAHAGGFRIKAVIHPAEEGGFWAEVPALRGCVSEGDTLDEVVANIREAARGWLEAAAEQNPPEEDPTAVVMELPL
jgi:predicted RNase H-like HicB family nuclease